MEVAHSNKFFFKLNFIELFIIQKFNRISATEKITDEIIAAIFTLI